MGLSYGFTLLELIVVIIIIGVLATLGFTQYTNVVEKMRSSEAIGMLGVMRKRAIEYYMKNGATDTMTYTDIGIGTASDQIPYDCVPSNYYHYRLAAVGGSRAQLRAMRCQTSETGKTPGFAGSYYSLYMDCYLDSGSITWQCDPGSLPSCNWLLPR